MCDYPWKKQLWKMLKICCSTFIQPEWVEKCTKMCRNVHRFRRNLVRIPSAHPASDWAWWLWAAPPSLQNSKMGESDGGRRGYSGGGTEIPSTPQSIQESSQQHWCFKHETQIFHLTEEEEREKRGEEQGELMQIRGWSGKREGWMDINDYVAETESNRLQNQL